MKKFSKLNESNKTVETSTNKKDFISNLISETLSIKNGKIVGKEVLTDAINKILEMNDTKTTIKVLENVKMASFRSFNLNWINEAIESEKKKLNKKDDECLDCDDDKKGNKKYRTKKGDDECLDCDDDKDKMVKESAHDTIGKDVIGDDVADEDVIKTEVQFRKWAKNLLRNAHGKDFDYDEFEKVVNDLIKKYGNDFGAMVGALKSGLNESKMEIEVEVKVKPEKKSIIDEFDEPSDEDDYEDDYEDEESGVFIKENSVNEMGDIFNLMKTINKINEEHHLTGKDERINFILSNLGNKKVEKYVIDKIEELPDYVKRSDIEKTLRNMSDKEIEDLYHGVEDTIGVKESKVELIKEEHHLNTKKDQIDFIVSNEEDIKVKSYILNYIKNHPEFLKSGNIKETLKKLNADEVEEIYLGVEKKMGIK